MEVHISKSDGESGTSMSKFNTDSDKGIFSESNIYSISEEEDSHAVTEIQEGNKITKALKEQTPESKEVDHDKNNFVTLTGSTLDDSNDTKDAKYCSINLPDNLESINGYDPQHKLEFLGLNMLDLRHGKLKEYYIFQDYKSLILYIDLTTPYTRTL
ncbi:hypothetical protein U3516DRAFT_755355 [Neocallimastix sp. 'constans']